MTFTGMRMLIHLCVCLDIAHYFKCFNLYVGFTELGRHVHTLEPLMYDFGWHDAEIYVEKLNVLTRFQYKLFHDKNK
jgi:hypothetical protein